MSEQEEIASVLGALEFHPTCSLYDSLNEKDCENRAFFSCRLFYGEEHGHDPQQVHLLCYRCRAQHIRITYPMNCPLCGASIATKAEWITDIKEL